MDQPEDTSTGFLPSYAQLIMNKFKKKSDETFDVYLCAEDQRFKAHKIVLAASGDYFHKMFSNNFKESREKEIMFDLDAKSLKIIIDYVYSGKIEFLDDNIEGVFEAAHLFQYDKICQHITENLTVSSENCITLLKIAEAYSLCSLNLKARNYLNQNFSDVWYRSKILELNFENLSSILRSNNIEIFYEEEIFTLVKNWINHDRINRVIHMPELMKLIRLHIMSPEFICKEVRPFCKDYPEATEFIIEAYEALLISEKMKNLPPKRNVPSVVEETKMFLCSEKTMLNIYKLSLSKTNSFCLHMSILLTKFFGAASIDNMIIIAGGFRNGQRSNQVDWLDLKTQRMVLSSSLPESRACCKISVMTNEDKSYNMYVIGGSFESGVTNSVLVWNSKIQIWKPVAAMINKRLYFGSTVLNKKLYVVGGVNENEEYLNTIEMYDPITDKWSECSPMVFKRCNPGVGAIDNNLYVIGGGAENEDDNECLTSVERYDSSTDKWSFVKSIPVGSSIPSVTECSFRSLIVAGENAVYRYIQDINEWILVTRIRKSLDCIDILTVNANF